MHTIVTMAVLLAATVVFGSLVLLVTALGLASRATGILDNAPRWWASALLTAAGVRVRVHGTVPPADGAGRVYACNHVSWFDILAMISVLRRFSFIAKAELFRIPLFGPAARAVGTIPIERENRKAAFQSYEIAAQLIGAGRNVVVFPEGTRGVDYTVRPLKKGPFVLAISAGAPIVPTIIHGTIHVNPRGSLRARPGVVDIHFLEPIPTAGLTYEDRDRLATLVRERMAAAMEQLHGVRSLDARTTKGTAA